MRLRNRHREFYNNRCMYVKTRESEIIVSLISLSLSLSLFITAATTTEATGYIFLSSTSFVSLSSLFPSWDLSNKHKMTHRKEDIEKLLRSSLQSMDSVGVVSIQDDTTIGSLSISTPSLVDSTTNLCEHKSQHKTKNKRRETRVPSHHAQLGSVNKFGTSSWNNQHDQYGSDMGIEGTASTAGPAKKGDRTFFVGMGILFSIFAITAAFLLIILPCYRMLNLNALLHSTTNGSVFHRNHDNTLSHPEQGIESHELPPGHRLLYQPVRSPLCDISENKKKFDCFPDYHGVNQRSCWSRGCCWRPTMDSYFYRDEDAKVRGVPACFLPANYSGYRVTKVDQSRTGATLELLKSSASLAWPREIRLLKVGVTFDSPHRLHFKVSLFIHIYIYIYNASP